ncbi:histidine phosphotransferase family protein [Parvularcula marina]|nr:histidine phosphotransferase family protein [Parvularcula marina]
MTDTDKIVQISSLMASRLCHDLVNPVGALNTGLEVLCEGEDPEMQEHALNLIKESTSKSIAVLTLARLAYGSSGGFSGDLDMREAETAAQAFYAHSKAELDWRLGEASLPKWQGRVLLNMLIAIERCVPRPGSIVQVEKAGGLIVTATGPKVKFSDEMARAFDGDDADIQPKDMPACLAALIARTGGAHITTDFALDERLVLRLDLAC